MHAYQQALINQTLSEEISETELADYYEKHQELFKVESPLIKGLFIKVPSQPLNWAVFAVGTGPKTARP